MKTISFRARALGQAVALSVWLGLLCGGTAQAQNPYSVKQIYTDLCNFDLRVPALEFVNDLEIVIYGIFPGGIADVVSTFPNPQWGPGVVSYIPHWAVNPAHPGFGFDQLIVKYGPGVNVQPFTWMHFGIHLRPCRLHVHVEAWWTYNNQRVARARLIHIHKIRVAGSWLIQITNPRLGDSTDQTLHLYGGHYFRPAPTKLPTLAQLTTEIVPSQFEGNDWIPLQYSLTGNPLYPGSIELAPGQVFTFRITNPGDDPTPIVFQAALRTTPELVPMPPAPGDDNTIMIATDRPAQEFSGDLNGDGAVGAPDLVRFRNEYNRTSVDNPLFP